MTHRIYTRLRNYSILRLEEKDMDQSTRLFSVDLRKIVSMRRIADTSGCSPRSKRYFLSLRDSVLVTEQSREAVIRRFHTTEVSFASDSRQQLVEKLLDDIITDNFLRNKRMEHMKASRTY